MRNFVENWRAFQVNNPLPYNIVSDKNSLGNRFKFQLFFRVAVILIKRWNLTSAKIPIAVPSGKLSDCTNPSESCDLN